MLTVLSANGAGGYQIANSLRFRSSASAYLSRTPASAGNRQTWTWSAWVKRGALGGNQGLFSVAGTTDTTYFLASISSDTIYIGNYSTVVLATTQVLRDPSAWYHIVIVLDTTQATANNRLKLYINGTQVTAFSNNNIATYYTQNSNQGINQAAAHSLGRETQGGVYYFDGYLAEVNFIDGQALTPSSFGQTSATTGVWGPKAYSGTYGTNGFYLKFNNGTSTTTLGYDSSSNGNNWTTNNISLTTGATYDWMIDSPTSFAGSSYGVGNYCTLNPLQPSSTTVVVPVDGNLKMTGTASGNNVTGTMAILASTYYEAAVLVGGGTIQYGVKNLTTGSTYVYENTGNKSLAGTSTAYGATYTTNDVIGIAVDPTNLTLQFYKNNVSQGVISSAFPSGSYVPFFYASNTQSSAANFGQRPFAGTVPSGYKSLCTYNLP